MTDVTFSNSSSDQRDFSGLTETDSFKKTMERVHPNVQKIEIGLIARLF